MPLLDRPFLNCLISSIALDIKNTLPHSGFIPGNVGRMDAIVRCGRCLAGGRGCLLKGPHLIPSLKFRLPYLINVHQSINPFLLKSRGTKYCPSGKTPTYNACGSLNCSFIMTSVMLTTFIYAYLILKPTIPSCRLTISKHLMLYIYIYTCCINDH